MVRALQRTYLEASTPALKAVLNCYQEGEVVTDKGIWRPGGRADSLIQCMGELVAWAGP